ncbi:phage tail assembly protein [Bradyrhizobium sp. S3.9.1]|uniref:phage tail assembly protein n=1 Tax=Bradyrhizobium sp. S3.9.1 TaxID=3156431 RepID=UPI003394F98D
MAEAATRRSEPVAETTAEKPTTSGVVVTLTDPVQAHGETVKELTFREPTGADLMMLKEGWPVDIDHVTGKVTPNSAVMGQMMPMLAAVPPSTIKALKSNDFSNCAYALSGFFVPDGRTMRY